MRTLAERRVAISRSGRNTPVGSLKDLIFGVTEALDFCEIARAFKSEAPGTITPKLERALKGPAHPANETPTNADGRNTMFELSLAAEWRLLGLNVEIGDPDITLVLDQTPFMLECKRPFQLQGIRRNIRRAGEQLRRKLQKNTSAFGVICISADRVFNPGKAVFKCSRREDFHQLGRWLRRLMSTHEPAWKKTNFHERIVAIVFHLATPGDIITDPFHYYRMAYILIGSIGEEGEPFRLFMRTLGKYYEAEPHRRELDMLA